MLMLFQTVQSRLQL